MAAVGVARQTFAREPPRWTSEESSEEAVGVPTTAPRAVETEEDPTARTLLSVLPPAVPRPPAANIAVLSESEGRTQADWGTAEGVAVVILEAGQMPARSEMEMEEAGVAPRIWAV